MHRAAPVTAKHKTVERNARALTSAVATTTTTATDDGSAQKRRKSASWEAERMAKELSADQKALVKTHVSRQTAEGYVKCCYCEKEISSKNIDRWASHLRHCPKTPEDVKTQIMPLRPASTASSAGAPAPVGTGSMGAPAAAAVALANALTAGHSHPHHHHHHSAPSAPAPSSALAAHSVAATLSATPGYSEVFKVHVSKDYMKFNAAHFIAYKVRPRWTALMRVARVKHRELVVARARTHAHSRVCVCNWLTL